MLDTETFSPCKVGQETLKKSKDKILKQEMPVAFQRVEESSQFLMEASILLEKDPFSKEAKKKLINGARGELFCYSAISEIKSFVSLSTHFPYTSLSCRSSFSLAIPL